MTSFEKKIATQIVVLSQDFPGQKKFVLGFLDLSWDKGTAGQGTFFVLEQRDYGTSCPGFLPTHFLNDILWGLKALCAMPAENPTQRHHD